MELLDVILAVLNENHGYLLSTWTSRFIVASAVLLRHHESVSTVCDEITRTPQLLSRTDIFHTHQNQSEIYQASSNHYLLSEASIDQV